MKYLFLPCSPFFGHGGCLQFLAIKIPMNAMNMLVSLVGRAGGEAILSSPLLGRSFGREPRALSNTWGWRR